VLADGEGLAAINHAPRIEAERVQILHALSRPLRAAGLGHGDIDLPTARLLTEIHAALARRDGEAADKARLACWGGAATRNDLINRVRHDLVAPPQRAPFAATAFLKPLLTRMDFIQTAERYDNCLATLAYGGDATSAFYEWLGEPGAVLELFDDRVFGWRLAQARFKHNVPVTAESRKAITAALEAQGVYVGRSAREIYDALRHSRGGRLKLSPLEDAAGYKFGGEYPEDDEYYD